MQPQHIKFKQIGAYNQDHCKHARKHHELEKIEKKKNLYRALKGLRYLSAKKILKCLKKNMRS